MPSSCTLRSAAALVMNCGPLCGQEVLKLYGPRKPGAINLSNLNP